MKTNEDNMVIYQWTDGNGLVRRTCFGWDSDFQDWLSENKDNLPDDIQAKVNSGELTIED